MKTKLQENLTVLIGMWTLLMLTPFIAISQDTSNPSSKTYSFSSSQIQALTKITMRYEVLKREIIECQDNVNDLYLLNQNLEKKYYDEKKKSKKRLRNLIIGLIIGFGIGVNI